MNALVPVHPKGALVRSDPQFQRRLALFAKTKGKGLTGPEIDECVEWCELWGANPFANEIYFFLFDRDDPDKRRVVPILSIGCYRKNAIGTRNYRPDERPARFTYDETLKGPANPAGIVDCEITAYLHSHGEWHPVTERLRWEERAPIIEGGADGFKWEKILGPDGEPDLHTSGKHKGKPKVRRVPIGENIKMLDPGKKNWATMPETMLAKCVEAAVIRKIAPALNGSYSEGELDRADVLELTAEEIVESADREQRLDKVAARGTILVDWMDGEPLVAVQIGEFHDKVDAFIKAHSKPGEEELSHILQWREKNREALRQFWGHEKDAALQLSKAFEDVANKLKAAGPSAEKKGKATKD